MTDKDSIRTEKDFMEWLRGAAFYVGRCRYGQFAGNFIINEAFDAAYSISALAGEKRFPNDTSPVGKKQIWYSSHDDPSAAMGEVVEQLRRFYFDVLNRSGE